MAHWIAGQTEGTLTPSFTPDSQSVLSILNTVYFHDEWVTRFSESRTEPDSFYLADGSSVSCDFMNQTFGSALVFGGKRIHPRQSGTEKRRPHDLHPAG